MNTCVSRLGHVGVEISDLSAWRQFATRILGMEESGETEDGGRFFRVDQMHHRLAVHPGSRDDIAYAGWEVDDEAMLEALADRLRRQGYGVVWGSESDARQRKVARLFRVADPDGLENEVFYALQDDATPFTPARDISGFVTGDLGMGHIVLCSADHEATLRFYRDGLGLKLSDTIDVDMGDSTMTVSFLHAGPRHHALAIVPLAAPKRLHHIMLQVQDMEDVGTTYDLCLDEGVPIAATLGCHTNDRMTSFYMQTPSGFQVEYGYGGIEIDDDVWEVGHYDKPSTWGHRSPQPAR